jgi:hypothetical protein
VGRILVPDGEREGLTTNAFGLRERPFAVDKPDGVVRIVLLGDSFVFGISVADDDRLGAVLERELQARAAPPAPRFEVLHMALYYWNIAAECAYLRRHADRLRPDLVVQVTFSNDLDDVTGVRGFGAEASFAPRHMQRADSLLLGRYAQSFLGHNTPNFLHRGQDWESRTRFADALAAVRGLRALLADLPGAPKHLLVGHWGALAPALHAHLGAELDPGSVVYLPLELSADRDLWITPSDPHWNARGHAEVAAFLYGTLRAEALLPGVTLGPWPEAEERAVEWARAGLAGAVEGRARMEAAVRDPVRAIDLPELTLPEARQVHGGLDIEGLVSPYASLVLHRAQGTRRLVVRGRALPDRALAGARVQVSVEELVAGELELTPGTALALDYALPAELDGRAFLDVRFESDDYVYRGDSLRHCVVFQLERVALE